MTDESISTPTMAEANENQEDVVIAIAMGATGSGKSSFIRLLTGDENVMIGQDIESETRDVQAWIFSEEESGRKVVVVDTPGFDDTRDDMTDTEVLKKITDFLVHTKPNGFIYFHPINHPRFGNQLRRNLKIFQKLCGTEALQNVVVVTTFWDNVKEEEGTRREEQLYSSEKAFKPLVEGGASFMRHDRTRESALRVIGRISTFTPKNTRIAEEIRADGKTVENTEAGSVRREELDHLIVQRNKDVAKLNEEKANIPKGDKAMRKEVEEDIENLQQQLDRALTELAELRGIRIPWHEAAAVIAGSALLATGGAVLVPAVVLGGLNLVGFSAGGVVGGSLAATIQSVVYGGATGGLFSMCQSFAATTVAPSIATLMISGTSAAVGGSVLVGAAIASNGDDKARNDSRRDAPGEKKPDAGEKEASDPPVAAS